MAALSWEFDCGHGSRRIVPRCPECGQLGELAGWQLTVVEHMAAYIKFYKLPPHGSGRKLVDELLGPVTGKCTACGGSGVTADTNPRGWELCANCDSSGRVRLCSDEEWERLRAEVLARMESG